MNGWPAARRERPRPRLGARGRYSALSGIERAHSAKDDAETGPAPADQGVCGASVIEESSLDDASGVILSSESVRITAVSSGAF